MHRTGASRSWGHLERATTSISTPIRTQPLRGLYGFLDASTMAVGELTRTVVGVARTRGALRVRRGRRRARRPVAHRRELFAQLPGRDEPVGKIPPRHAKRLPWR